VSRLRFELGFRRLNDELTGSAFPPTYGHSILAALDVAPSTKGENGVYQFSRSIYREIAHDIAEPAHTGTRSETNHARVLHACEAAVERLATDRHYFARPARSLFQDIRAYFPMNAQLRVYRVIECHMRMAQEFFERAARLGRDVDGNLLQCRATTRKGRPCQRMPLPHNGYCPSHQHLADTERLEQLAGAEPLQHVVAA